jgi:hypothetical protein
MAPKKSNRVLFEFIVAMRIFVHFRESKIENILFIENFAF